MSANSIPDHLRCDHLFLLVDTNPLPNWVATRLLLKPGGQVHLVYTSGVKKHMERLQEALGQDQISVNAFSTEDADDLRIFQDVRAQAEKLKAESGKVIGLNYTGGTKMMSVHSHRAFHALDFLQSLSYLDARTLSLKFDHPSTQEPIKIALAPEVLIPLQTLLFLHESYDPRNVTYETTAKCPDAARGLIDIHSNYSGQNVWFNWYNPFKQNINDRRLKRDLSYYRQLVSRLDEVQLLEESDFRERVENSLKEQKKFAPPLIQTHLKKITEGYRKLLAELQVEGGATFLQVVRQNPQFEDSIEVANWLAGKWLEHYTLSQIEACRREAQINPNGLAINLETKSEEKREFEADVIALRGYQLFYFSCYSGSEFKLSKSKLFEAMVRSAQLGGEEAKFALVGCIDTADNLRRQIEADWGQTGQVAVFGRDSLPVLRDKLKEWFIQSPSSKKSEAASLSSLPDRSEWSQRVRG